MDGDRNPHAQELEPNYVKTRLHLLYHRNWPMQVPNNLRIPLVDGRNVENRLRCEPWRETGKERDGQQAVQAREELSKLVGDCEDGRRAPAEPAQTVHVVERTGKGAS